LFLPQLKAILRVARDFPVRVMYPMVSTPEEFRRACALMMQARGELGARGVRTPERIETGMMVEVPAAALAADAFARDADFFSIGTNDLTQYTYAVERGNPEVASLAGGLAPAVMRLIAEVVRAAHAEGKWVGVCGEPGGDAEAIPLLLGLGVDELSMAPPLIPRAKEIVREASFAEARARAQMAF
jgi:phosphoenolpyruvate-protein kinase (PTS system EI component)